MLKKCIKLLHGTAVQRLPSQHIYEVHMFGDDCRFSKCCVALVVHNRQMAVHCSTCSIAEKEEAMARKPDCRYYHNCLSYACHFQLDNMGCECCCMYEQCDLRTNLIGEYLLVAAIFFPLLYQRIKDRGTSRCLDILQNLINNRDQVQSLPAEYYH